MSRIQWLVDIIKVDRVQKICIEVELFEEEIIKQCALNAIRCDWVSETLWKGIFKQRLIQIERWRASERERDKHTHRVIERASETKNSMEIMKFCYLCFDRTKDVYPVVDETFMQKFINFSPGNITVSSHLVEIMRAKKKQHTHTHMEMSKRTTTVMQQSIALNWCAIRVCRRCSTPWR